MAFARTSSPAADVFLGLDIGTSSVKGVATTAHGRVLCEARESLVLLSEEPLAAEQDPESWWQASVAVLRTLAAGVPDTRDVTAIGLTGQKHALLALDADDRPLGRAILWADGRAHAEAEELAAIYPAIRKRSGYHPMPGFIVPKWLRFLRGQPELGRAARCLLFAKDYVRLRLAGVKATDRTEASASQVYDFRSDGWIEELCDLFEMPKERVPIHRSTDFVGNLTREAASLTGLPPAIPISAGAGDNEAAAVGAGALGEGRVAVILGTSGTVVGWSMQRTPAGGLVWNRHVLPRGYAGTGTVLSAGRAIDWARRTFYPPGARMVELLREAEAADPRIAPLVFLPSLVGERSPVSDPHATGSFAGLRPTHGRPHLARAVMEGVAISLAEIVVLLRGAGVEVSELRLTSGGAASMFWRKLIGSAAGLPVRFVGHGHAPALGAAAIAAAGTGHHGTLQELVARWVEPGPVEAPDPAERERLARLATTLRALRNALRGVDFRA